LTYEGETMPAGIAAILLLAALVLLGTRANRPPSRVRRSTAGVRLAPPALRRVWASPTARRYDAAYERSLRRPGRW
jgi:hypothetical protein